MNGSPGFAVFLNGEWGSGKTWFINKFRETQEKQKRHKFIYVSLKGATDALAIDFEELEKEGKILPFKKA